MLKRLNERLVNLEFKVAPRQLKKKVVYVSYIHGEDPLDGWVREHGPDVPYPDPSKFLIIGIVTPNHERYARIMEEDAALLARLARRDAEGLEGEDRDAP